MKKLFLVILIIALLSLFGCNGSYYYINDDGGNHSVKDIPTGQEFIVNTSTKKYHLPSCRYASDPNLEKWNDESFLIDRGYSSCKACMPDN
ncbi:MAG: hypothetical protein IJW54_05090 [Clostridia bacterium]|nr:hypothetical protein [Clostridia bacterium]